MEGSRNSPAEGCSGGARHHDGRGCTRPSPPEPPSAESDVLEQPSLCRMHRETLGRRNAALVQSTELDRPLLSNTASKAPARASKSRASSTTGTPVLIGGRHDAKGARPEGARGARERALR